MAKFNFNLRQPGAHDETPINLVIRWGTNRLVYPTKETIEPRHWCNDPAQRNYQRAKSTKAFPEHPEFNERLEDLLKTAKGTFRTFVTDNGTEPQPDDLRDALDIANGRKTPSKKMGVVEYYADFVDSSAGTQNRQGKPVSPTYYRRLRLTLVLLKDHLALLHKKDIPFTALDITFVRGFTKYLTTTKNYAPNSVRSFLKTMRMVVSYARENGQEVNAAFYSKKLVMPSEESFAIYLGTPELEDLWHLDLGGNPRLDRVRDLFLLQCWVGLRFGDLKQVSDKNIDGNLLRIRQEKTDAEVIIPMHPVAAAVMSKYEGNPPTMSNQRFNDYLKEVVAMVPTLQVDITFTKTKGGITRTFTVPKYQLVASHTARRSFACNMYLAGDMHWRTIAQVTGHKSEAAFLRYIAPVTNTEHAQLMAKSPLFIMPMLRKTA